LPALEHHTYSEGDVEEGGIKIKEKKKKTHIISIKHWIVDHSRGRGSS
jgi:hypothetical protein